MRFVDGALRMGLVFWTRCESIPVSSAPASCRRRHSTLAPYAACI